MHLRAPLAVLLVGALATLPALTAPSSAGAVTIHVHTTVERVIGHEADGPLTTPKETVRVVRLKPPDSDDDGLADGDDRCPQTAAATEDGCPAPVVTITTPAPSYASSPAAASYASSGTAASVASCESGGDPTTNTGNGYYGAYQFDDATWAAAGGSTAHASDASMTEQTAVFESWYAQHPDAWPVCG